MDHSHHLAPRARRRPRWLAALVAVVAALFLAGGLAVPAQAAAATTTLTVSASDYSVSSGASVTVTGTLKRGTKAVSGVYVTLQKRTAGSSTWTTVTKTKTSSKGKVSAKVSKLAKNTELRAVFSGTSKYKASKSSTKKVYVTQKVSISSTSTTKPTKGGTIWLKGTTTSGLAGKTVKLQKKSGSTWTTVSSATVSSKSTFSVRTTAGNAGKATYRVYAPASVSTKSATSAEKAFTVYQWFNLNDVAPIGGTVWEDGVVGLRPEPAAINGVSYARALGDVHFAGMSVEEDTAAVVWNLGGRCTTFTSLIGIDDASVANSQAAFHTTGFQTVGAETKLKEVTLGETVYGTSAQKKTQAISGFSVFGLHATPKSTYVADEEGYPVFADAKVLCSSKPAA